MKIFDSMKLNFLLSAVIMAAMFSCTNTKTTDNMGENKVLEVLKARKADYVRYI